MKDLWIPINIPNLSEIQQELSNMVTIDPHSTKTHAFSINEQTMIEKCSLFMNWFMPRNKQNVRLYRFYVTEPYGRLGAHIDGSKTVKVPFGMNIPVLNCKNTFQIYYDCHEENITNDFKKGYLAGCVPKDRSLIKERTRIEIVRPYFTRNDILHSIENNNPTYRIMFTVRWALHPIKARNIEEVFDLEL